MDYKIQFELNDATGWSQEFTSLRNLLKFLQQEYEFWDELNQNLKNSRGSPYLSNHHNFSQPINKLQILLDTKIVSDDDLDRELRLIKPHFNGMASTWLYSKNTLTKHYLSIIKNENLTIANAFLEYVLNQSTGNVSSQEYFKGYLKAYEYQNINIDLVKRRDSEKKSLSKIREHFQNSQDKLFGEVEIFKKDFHDWEDNTKNASEKLYRVQKKLGIRKLKQQDKLFDADLSAWKAKVQELENTYEEKLKLQGPAKYWSEASKRYEKHGMNWARAIVFFVILGVVIFYSLLSQWFSGEKLPLQLSSLQGAILFASLAAMFTYLMKLLSKMTFSSFHLMRDAQEREQLTYLYLALTHESEIDKSSRDIVLQSLFSRSETGLLVKENGPTMPTISEILPRAGKTN